MHFFVFTSTFKLAGQAKCMEKCNNAKDIKQAFYLNNAGGLSGFFVNGARYKHALCSYTIPSS